MHFIILAWSFLWLPLWILNILATAAVASSKGASGFLWGFYAFIAPPFSLLHAIGYQSSYLEKFNMSVKAGYQQCAYCMEFKHPKAVNCPHCAKALKPIVPTK